MIEALSPLAYHEVAALLLAATCGTLQGVLKLLSFPQVLTVADALVDVLNGGNSGVELLGSRSNQHAYIIYMIDNAIVHIYDWYTYTLKQSFLASLRFFLFSLSICFLSSRSFFLRSASASFSFVFFSFSAAFSAALSSCSGVSFFLCLSSLSLPSFLADCFFFLPPLTVFLVLRVFVVFPAELLLCESDVLLELDDCSGALLLKLLRCCFLFLERLGLSVLSASICSNSPSTTVSQSVVSYDSSHTLYRVNSGKCGHSGWLWIWLLLITGQLTLAWIISSAISSASFSLLPLEYLEIMSARVIHLRAPLVRSRLLCLMRTMNDEDFHSSLHLAHSSKRTVIFSFFSCNVPPHN